MQRLIWTIIASFVMTVVFGQIMIPWLKKLKFGQTIYDLGPESHKKKQGTPTMGGIIFAIPALIAGCAFAYGEARFDHLLMIVVSAVGFGLVGFVDDFIKVKLKRSLGLTPKQKLVPQIILAAGLSVWAYLTPSIGAELTVPFFNVSWNLGWVYIPVMMFILVGTVNSANLLDGLDGLLAGCSMIDFIAMMLICLTMAAANGANSANLLNTAIMAGAMAGALMSFLRFNGYPARVFMGDVGSFFIGGMLVGTVNSANLLDGLDGLLAGCSMIDFIAMMLICLTMAAANGANSANLLNTAIMAGAMAGALMSFLRFNGYPARVFMGDVGSFFIGGALVGLTMVTRLSLLLPVIALAMFVSSLSDIIQVGYFKYTKKKYGAGRRVFKMAPLHHHFELSGMPETRIVTMYYIATAALCLLAMLGFVA